jgi:hypothetical protein
MARSAVTLALPSVTIVETPCSAYSATTASSAAEIV